MLEFRLDVLGAEAVDTALARLDPLDQNKILNGIAQQLKQQVRHRIISEKRSPDGTPWKPNRAGTPILHQRGDTNGLLRSIDSTVQGDTAIVGSAAIHAAIHQYGGTIVPKKAKRLVFRIGNRQVFAKKVTIPARPFIGLSDENKEDILDNVASYIQKQIRGA